MKILINTEIFDPHATAIEWGLKKLGCQPIVWHKDAFPISTSSSWSVNQQDTMANIRIGESAYSAPFDVVWNRRFGARPTPKPTSHPDDIKVINSESEDYLRNLMPFLGDEKTLWVNPYSSSRQAEQKMAQLVAAKSLGFIIPDTLISNDYAAVLAFFTKHNGRIIYKAFNAASWEKEDGSAIVLRTSALFPEHMQSEAAISACPGIYQVLIEKEVELRVTVMGDKILAGVIDSQSQGTSIDWRYDGEFGNTPIKATILEKELSNRCLALCRKLDLQFACLDLIVSKTGEVIFLEVNQAGQFLWVEDVDPSVTMLDSFCRFLLRGTVPLSSSSPLLTYADFCKSPECEKLNDQVKEILEKKQKNAFNPKKESDKSIGS